MTGRFETHAEIAHRLCAPGLEIERIDPCPLPLGLDTTADAYASYPKALEEWLFGHAKTSDEAAADEREPCATYAILDASRILGAVEMIESSELRAKCLYKDTKDGQFADIGPWLIQLEPDNSLTRKMFSAPPQNGQDAPWLFWSKAGVLFLRSAFSFDRLYDHLRRFNRVDRRTNTQSFLRYWDVKCFEDSLLAFADAGMAKLFNSIQSFIVYFGTDCLRLTWTGDIPDGPFTITDEHSARYTELRRARLNGAIIKHFRSLPEFQSDDVNDLHEEVGRYLQRGRELGVRDAKDLHTFALGLALARGETSFRRDLGATFEDDTIPISDRRYMIMSKLTERIDLAKAAHNERQAAQEAAT